MTDAAVKVDPEYYSARLLAADGNAESQMAGGGSLNGGGQASWGGGGGRGGGGGGMARGLPDLPDYLVRQHSLLGFYLSLNPGDEADAERHWGFPQPQRMAIAGVTVVVPLLLALFLQGSWLWRVSVIAVVTVGVRLAVSFSLATFPDVEVAVQGYRLAMWPHLTLGALALTGLVWFMTAAASGTGWSTLWLGFTSLVFLAGAEAALRGGMWHFKWWAPAERFSFLKPWGDSSVGAGGGRGGVESYGGYAPPRPSAAPPAAVPPRPEYGSNMGAGGAVGGVGGVEGGGGGGSAEEMLGAMNDSGAGNAAAAAAATAAAAAAAAPDASSNTESTGLLEESTTTGEEELEAIFASESV